MGQIFGDLFGASEQAQYDKQASGQALTGYNWLTGANGVSGYTANGNAANSQIAALLGIGGNSAGAKNSFNNYLNSTGYQFQKQQGDTAVNGTAASKGILNSGATAKALTSYNSGLASNYFNSYLSQLGGVAGQGLEASGQIGQAGTTGGGNAAGYTQNIGNAWANGVNNAIGAAGTTFGQFI